MASTIALLGFLTFVVIMVIFHKLQKWYTPASTAMTTANRNQVRDAQIESHDNLQSTPTSSNGSSNNTHDECGTPTTAYAIAIADASPIHSPCDRATTGKISFIRFSGFSDSDASSNARSTALSFWSALTNAKEPECHSPSAGEPVEPTPQRARPYIPQLRDDHDVEGIHTVEIAPMDGFLERNMLSFKPQKSRALTTKHVKKNARPIHAFLV